MGCSALTRSCTDDYDLGLGEKEGADVDDLTRIFSYSDHRDSALKAAQVSLQVCRVTLFVWCLIHAFMKRWTHARRYIEHYQELTESGPLPVDELVGMWYPLAQSTCSSVVRLVAKRLFWLGRTSRKAMSPSTKFTSRICAWVPPRVRTILLA